MNIDKATVVTINDWEERSDNSHGRLSVGLFQVIVDCGLMLVEARSKFGHKPRNWESWSIPADVKGRGKGVPSFRLLSLSVTSADLGDQIRASDSLGRILAADRHLERKRGVRRL